jgi:hypothetical protein
VRAVTKLDHRRLAELAEGGLRELGFVFLKNGGGDVIEFEVRSPFRFIVSVQDMTQVRLGFPFIAMRKVQSMIEIRPVVGGEQRGDVLLHTAESIAEALSPSIPRSKWKGLNKLAS